MSVSSYIPDDEAGSILTVDLGAIVRNWRKLAALAAPAQCGAAIKANAYGLGAEQVGAALAKAGCRTFFVAHVPEGRRLRAVVPDAAIYVLNGLQRSIVGALRSERLHAVIGSREELEIIRDSTTSSPALPYAVHVDTGMNRLGFGQGEALSILVQGGFDAVRPALVMSHFVSSEEPDDALNDLQIARFAAFRASFSDRARIAGPSAIRTEFSISNSSGIFLKEEPFCDLVRPGYALYGGNPSPGRPNPMEPVARLESRIIQLRNIEAGETVGYNAQWVARRRRRIATISLGYADGIFRSLGNRTGEDRGGFAKVRGMVCPLAGRVSMDLIALDVTDAGPDVSIDDVAVLLGDGITVDDMAERAGTNGYNILTNLGARFHRRYVGA